MTRPSRPLAFGIAGFVASTLAACSDGEPTSVTDPAAVEIVLDACERTEATSTGHYVQVDSTRILGGVLDRVTEGEYDIASARASATLTLEADNGAELIFPGATSLRDAELQMVRSASDVFMHSPAWTGRLESKWMHFDEQTVQTALASDGLMFEAIGDGPTALFEALTSATEPASVEGATYVVQVPSTDLVPALGTSMVRRLVGWGASPRVEGTEEIMVTIEDGLITQVSFEATRLFQKLLAEAEGAQAEMLDSANVEITIELILSDHGNAVEIAIPPQDLWFEPRFPS